MVKIDSDLKDLLPVYLERRKRDIATIRSDLAVHKFSSIEILGHRLSGNAGSFGLDPLGTIGHELELAARAKDPSSVETITQRLEEYLSQLEICYD